MQRILFFSDTHLNPTQSERIGFLADFMEKQSKNTDFYILGDLFDIWIGPGHIKLGEYQNILKELKKLSSSGININFIPGNRDYMVGPELTESTGIIVLSEIYELNANGKKILLTHGDLLCTQDRDYQRYRRVMRSGVVKTITRSLPHSVGQTIGQGLKKMSARSKETKTPMSKNIVMDTVQYYFDLSFDAVICGHIHQAQHIEVPTNGKTKHLFVTGQLAPDTKGGFSLPYVTMINGQLELVQ
ncbi:MAG: UDP-2,3-diacylglucosamine diphosphatase [Candidatus Brocadiia bacterium]